MRLFLYVIKEYFKYVVGTVVLTVFLFILFDFIHQSTKDFAEYKPAGEIIARFYLYQVPTQLVQAMPIAGLLGSVVSMILLSRTNEITAMRAAGLGPWQIGLPLAAGGFILSVLSFVLGEVVVPRAAQRVHYVQQVQIRGEKDEQLGEGGRWLRNEQTFVNFEDYDPVSQTLTNVRLVDVKPNFRPEKAIESEYAYYSPEAKTWTLTGVRILHFRRNGTLESVEQKLNQVTHLPIEPKKLQKDRRKTHELSLRELRDLLDRRENSGGETIPLKVDYHGKVAYPFAAFVVSLIGLKFGYRSERSTETAKGVLLAFFIGISYWFILTSTKALGLRGDLHPFFAAWLPNVVVLMMIIIDAWRGRKA
jgi:lipopolysaccharide export system permease protein